MELATIFLRIQTKESILRVNKSEITGRNTLNGDHFEIKGNHELNRDQETLFLVFLQICDQCFNP